MSTQKTKRQPLSDKHKLIVSIIAIVLVAVIAVSVTLIVMLQPKNVTPDNNNPSNNPSSSLPVKNGDFGLIGSEDTTFPKSAPNWTSYTYKAPSGSTHDFDKIESTEKVVMGIVDTEEENWATAAADVKLEGVPTIENPKQHEFSSENEKHSNSNVYMIASKESTNAGIMSDSVTVSATTSVKITVWINTSQLTAGGASIMIQNSSSTPNAKEENRYAYKYEIAQQDGWQEFSFYVFNRKTSTQYVRVSVSLGNIYEGTNAEGVLFVDDIALETVTANDYRIKADEAQEGDTTYKIIEKSEDTTVPAQSGYTMLKDYNGTTEKTPDYSNSNAYLAVSNGYSPFTNKDDFYKDGEGENAERVPTGFGIYKIENRNNTKTPVALELAQPINMSLNEDDFTVQDYHHISFWVRTVSINGNALAYANILVESKVNDKWESLANGDFTATTEQSISTDTNNGWSKFDIYFKPSKTPTLIRLVFALGSANGYEGTDYAPEGELYVTTPYHETISSSAYTNASSATASKKYDLIGSTAETSVTNGSFSSVNANTKQPTNWTPVFAGQNAIYRDGQGDQKIGSLSTKQSTIAGSGIVNWQDEFGSDSKYVDDDEGKILKLISNKNENNEASSFGYLSNEITASAHSVYAFSVMVKLGTDVNANAAIPYFYLIQSGVSRDKAILASVESKYTDPNGVNGTIFCQADSIYKDTGWVRYYIVYVTGDEDISVRLALFNGSIDGTRPASNDATIYYDKVTMQKLGTYLMVEDEDNKDADSYVVKFNADSKFDKTTIADCENVDELLEEIKKVSDEIVQVQPTEEEWTEMKKIPDPADDDDDDNDDTTTPTEKRDVNLALLFSILSSVLLLAALAVVVILKIFKKRKNS